MSDFQQIHLVKRDRELVIDTVISLVAVAIVYCALNPGVADDVRSWIGEQAGRFAYRVAVWSTRISIRTLPETDE